MLLGVLYGQRIINDLRKNKVIHAVKYLIEAANNEHIDVFLFTPDNIDLDHKNINGLMYNQYEKKWQMKMYPFPNMIYDRAIFNENEKETGNYLRKILKEEYNIPFINSKHFFNKWETYITLSSKPQTKIYLPDTAKFKRPMLLDKFLNKYTAVYIKESGGKLGKNIYKVQKENDLSLIVSYRDKNKNHIENMNLQDLFDKVVKNRFHNKLILVQQGIELACFDDRPFDIRILVQKNGLGEWEIVDKSIRLSAFGSVVTNISSGGEIKKLNDIIPKLFPSDTEKILNELDNLTYEVCYVLENKYGALGELGIDAVLDKSGRLWFIEVNGKPAKLCILKSKDKELINRAYSNIIRYFKFYMTSI